jgi:hypothetical protein
MIDKMALICKHCEKGERPILYVAHTACDGVFQFLCGEDGHDVDDADPIHISHVIQDDPTVLKLLSIRESFEADRETKKSEWDINYNTDLF